MSEFYEGTYIPTDPAETVKRSQDELTALAKGFPVRMPSVSDVEVEPCEICGSCDCLDAQIAYWFLRATRAEAAIAERDAEIAKLQAAIKEIVNISRRDIFSKDDYQRNFHVLNKKIYEVGTWLEGGG
jgi:hypothetical protein